MNCPNGHVNPPRYPPQLKWGSKIGRCKLCSAVSRKKYWKRHHDKCLKGHRLYNAKYAELIRSKSREYTRKLRTKILNHYCKGNPRCMNKNCAVSSPEILEFDHINGDGHKLRKLHGRSGDFFRWIIKNNYPPIIKVLCPNCHRAKHAGTSWL